MGSSTEDNEGLSMEETISRRICQLTSSPTYFTPSQMSDPKVAKCEYSHVV